MIKFPSFIKGGSTHSERDESLPSAKQLTANAKQAFTDGKDVWEKSEKQDEAVCENLCKSLRTLPPLAVFYHQVGDKKNLPTAWYEALRTLTSIVRHNTVMASNPRQRELGDDSNGCSECTAVSVEREDEGAMRRQEERSSGQQEEGWSGKASGTDRNVTMTDLKEAWNSFSLEVGGGAGGNPGDGKVKKDLEGGFF